MKTKKEEVSKLIDEFKHFAMDSIEDEMGYELDPLSFIESCMEVFLDLKSEEEKEPRI